MRLKSLENKKIIISGASKGLGSICAQALSKEGAALALIARSENKLNIVRDTCENPESHIILPADLTQKEEREKAIHEAKKFLQKVDVVLHVTGGGFGKSDPLIEYNDFEFLFKVNLGVAAEINRLIIPDMIQKGIGNLVHIASIASFEATGSVGYSSVKAALGAYVRTLGRNMVAKGIIVTGILPGMFYAPGNSWERHAINNPEMVQKVIESQLPRKQMGQAEELIPMIKLLCSDNASVMGGCLVPIDGGEGLSFLNQ